MAFGKFVKNLLGIKQDENPDEDISRRPSAESAGEPGAEPETKPEPSKAYLWFLLALLIVGNLIVFVYFGFATSHYLERERTVCVNPPDDFKPESICGIQWCSRYGLLILLFTVIYIGLIYFLIIKPLIGRAVYRSLLAPAEEWWMRISRTWLISIILFAVALSIVIIIVVIEVSQTPAKITGITAPIFFIAVGFLFSTKMSAIKWRIVVTGIFAQFFTGVVCLSWPVGRDFFQCFGDKVAIFLGFTAEGSRFVFGQDLVNNWVFAFAVLPVIFFFSFCVSILYYLGAMQWIVMKLGWILQQAIGTTVCESVVAAANIFLGMSESPLLIRPYVKQLTASEIHTVMASGFATVSGTVLAAYISFGASPAHLITASVMAAPGALAFSKLYWPETEESKTSAETITLEKSEDESILGAAATGAGLAIPIVLGITANIVAFVGFVAFLNAIVNWIFILVDIEGVNFVWILSKLFVPLAWGMGVPYDDCGTISEVLALKTIINEFVAYERLGVYTRARKISARASGIGTYAICGFANPGSMGILIGSLSAISPTSKSYIVGAAFRAFVVGSIICFVSASFAGILMNEDMEKAMYDRLFEQLDSTKNVTVPEIAEVPEAAPAQVPEPAPEPAPPGP